MDTWDYLTTEMGGEQGRAMSLHSLADEFPDLISIKEVQLKINYNNKTIQMEWVLGILM